jgi:hypothetical protein
MGEVCVVCDHLGGGLLASRHVISRWLLWVDTDKHESPDSRASVLLLVVDRYWVASVLETIKAGCDVCSAYITWLRGRWKKPGRNKRSCFELIRDINTSLLPRSTNGYLVIF